MTRKGSQNVVILSVYLARTAVQQAILGREERTIAGRAFLFFSILALPVHFRLFGWAWNACHRQERWRHLIIFFFFLSSNFLEVAYLGCLHLMIQPNSTCEHHIAGTTKYSEYVAKIRGRDSINSGHSKALPAEHSLAMKESQRGQPHHPPGGIDAQVPNKCKRVCVCGL